MSVSSTSVPKACAEQDSQALPGKAERLGYLGMALFLGSLLMTPVDKAEAATFTVGNTNDSGAGSLRQAVLDANATAGVPDTIVFTTGLTGSINLNSQINITDPVAITGPGPAALAVDGQDNYRIFYVNANADTHEVLISGLTLRNGFTSGNGGAIYATNTHLTLENCTLSANYAAGAGGLTAGGGALLFNSDNKSYDLTVTDSTFSYNTCQNRDGGAIYAEDGYLTITGCTFDHNSAGDDGGAIGSDDVDELYIADSTFLYNIATGGPPAGGGGAINMKELRGPATVLDSTISENTASHVGGGLAFERTQTTDPITISNSYIENNSATYSGGGIFGEDANLTVSDSTISGNSSSRTGGGVFGDYRDLTIENCSITNNSSSYDGAGVYFRSQGSGSLRIKATDISGNETDRDGGALYARYLDTLSLANCTLNDNVAADDAGALGVDTVNQFLMDSCLVDNNSASGDDAGGLFLCVINGDSAILNTIITNNYCNEDGGGVYLYRASDYSPLTISNCTLANNYAYEDGGGFALYRVGDYSDVTFTDCIVSGNFARATGGGLAIDTENDIDGVIAIDRCRITGNGSFYRGGGIFFYCGESGLLRITDTTIASNSSLDQVGGGAFVYCEDTGKASQPLQIETCTISNNTSPGPGGGILAVFYYGGASIINSTFSGNQSLYAFGGGLLVDIEEQDESCFIENCTFYNNRSDGHGAGISFFGDDIFVTSSIVSNNISTLYGTSDLSGDFFYVNYSLFGSSTNSSGSGSNNLYGYTAYLEPLANNGGPTRTHALTVSSPAIDAGVNAAGSTFDQRGAPFLRTIGTQTDIGAVEFNVNDPPPPGLPFGFGADADDDGFSDDVEDAAGTDPTDPTETPLGGTSLQSEDELNPLTVLKYGNVLKFNKPGTDTIKLKGKIELPDGTPLSGVDVVVDIAGNSAAFTLDEKGAGIAAIGKIKVKPPKGGVALITLTLKGAFQTPFADNADMQNVTTSGEAKIVRVAITFGSVGAFRTDVVVSYKAKQGSSGKAK